MRKCVAPPSMPMTMGHCSVGGLVHGAALVPGRWRHRFFRTSRGSCCKQNASSEQVEAGVTIHLAFDQFQSVDLPFGLAVAPGRGESGVYRAAVFRQPGSKRFHRRHAAPAGLDEPGIQFGTGCTGIGLVASVARAHKGGEPAGKFRDNKGVPILLHSSDRRSVGRRQRCGRLHEQPRKLPGRGQRRDWADGWAWVGRRAPAPTGWRRPGRPLTSFAHPSPHLPGCSGEALCLQLPPQHGGILAPFGNPCAPASQRSTA